MSNASRGTRVVSAGDWVRMKRLLGARNNGYSADGYLDPTSSNFNKDVAPTTSLQIPYGLPIHVFPVGGSSKIRRPASNWIDNVAFRYGDIVFSSQQGVNQSGSLIEALRFCTCTKTNLANKDVICRKCLTRKPEGQQQGGQEGGGGERGTYVILDWTTSRGNPFDANNAFLQPACFMLSTVSLTLPYTFDPCTNSFSFSFTNITNLENVTQITIRATTTGGIPYSFIPFTLTDFSIVGGGSIDNIVGFDIFSGSITLSVSLLTTSSIITVNANDPEVPFCSLVDICIQVVLPPT